MSRYSKKHYEDIANTLRKAMLDSIEDERANEIGNYIRSYLATMFQDDNPNFDRERFLEATR